MDDPGTTSHRRRPAAPRTPQELAALAKSLAIDVPVSADTSILSRPVSVGHLRIPNALAVHPMEGADGDAEGRAGDLTLRRYDRFAGGGAGLLWIEAIAVVPEGRANPRQLWLHEGSRAAFASMVSRIRGRAAARFGPSHRPVLVAQLTHSGRYCRPQVERRPLIAQHIPAVDASSGVAADLALVTDDYLDRLVDGYVRAAALAFDVGFDAVDIKACHGYLVSELLGARTRPGRYGGPLENRAALLVGVVERIRSQLGPDKPIATRLGVFDAIDFPYGWGVSELAPRTPDPAEAPWAAQSATPKSTSRFSTPAAAAARPEHEGICI